MQSSRRDLFINMADNFIFKNNQITLSPSFAFINSRVSVVRLSVVSPTRVLRPIGKGSFRILYMASYGRSFSLVRPFSSKSKFLSPDLDIQPRFHCTQNRCGATITKKKTLVFVVIIKKLIFFLLTFNGSQ